MIDLSMLCLVGADMQQQILHCPMPFRKIIVVDGNVWGLHFGPSRELSSFEVSEFAGIGKDGFFFEVAYEAVAGTWTDKVGEEHGVKEDALSSKDCETHEPPRFAHLVDVLVNAFGLPCVCISHLQEYEQVHSLVVTLFQQSLDPAMITLHPPHAM
jgi:hypothetical protein